MDRGFFMNCDESHSDVGESIISLEGARLIGQGIDEADYCAAAMPLVNGIIFPIRS